MALTSSWCKPGQPTICGTMNCIEAEMSHPLQQDLNFDGINVSPRITSSHWSNVNHFLHIILIRTDRFTCWLSHRQEAESYRSPNQKEKTQAAILWLETCQSHGCSQSPDKTTPKMLPTTGTLIVFPAIRLCSASLEHHGPWFIWLENCALSLSLSLFRSISLVTLNSNSTK